MMVWMTPLLLTLAFVSGSMDYQIQPVPFTSVHLSDKLWGPKLELNRSTTIPFVFKQCEDTGRVANFERAARALKGEKVEHKMPIYPFDDSDVYKAIEGASYSMALKKDAKLDAYVDSLIVKIAAAQEPDGYLYTARTIDPKHPHEWSGAERWVNEEEQSHELYNLGHLYEAAFAHYEATGKKNLLSIAIKTADLLDRTFGPGKRTIWPGHQVIEMGLVKLTRIIGDPKYLKLAKFMLDSRGGKGDYWQAHIPVVKQREAVGHAVRATYMYSGMADVAALTGDKDYITAISAIWEDVVSKKLYINGGIGQTGSGEAFGTAYDLPNMSAYCETCAQIGNDFWNERMFLLTGDAKYIDVFERTLYNGVISGISLDGKGFFYPNPLASRGQHQRSPWFACPCCPTNVVRFMPSLPGYFYAHKGNTLFVNLYANSSATVKLPAGNVVLDQATGYPWDGGINLTVKPAKKTKFPLKLRIPGWAMNQAVPSDLYRFEDKLNKQVTLKLNGKDIPVKPVNGYVTLDRVWTSGDSVTLNLPMQIRRIVANSKVAEDAGKVAIQRGPVVYCAEGIDMNTKNLRNLVLDDDVELKPTNRPELLGGTTTLEGTIPAVSFNDLGLVEQNDTHFVMIPYYKWCNRGRGTMEIWMPGDIAAAKPTPKPTIASQAKVTASAGANGVNAMNDLEEPRNSVDQTAFCHWWPKKGTTEWAQYDFAHETTLSEASIYWFDDTGVGECRVPESAKLLYLDGTEWKEIQLNESIGVAKDKFNVVTFPAIKTKALRLEIKLQQNWSTGVQEWKVK